MSLDDRINDWFKQYNMVRSRADARRAELKKLSDERAKRRELRIERTRLKNPVYCQMTGEVV